MCGRGGGAVWVQLTYAVIILIISGNEWWFLWENDRFMYGLNDGKD